MRNYCTLFNKKYLARGLALYQSLLEHSSSFHLYVYCFDEETLRYFQEHKSEHLTPVSLAEFENEDLLRVKPDRNIGEYCWTSTPAVILHTLKTYNVPDCTYIDADLLFFSDPEALFSEMPDNRSVMITEHRYSPEYDQSATSGVYCVQFVTFKNNEDGLRVLKWWYDRCIEWCFDRFEDGKFGDQKYLDDWTDRFKGIVHVMQNPGGGIAPWNMQQYTFNLTENNRLKGIETASGSKFDVNFFHFHDFKFYENGGWGHSSDYYISDDAYQYFYKYYLKYIYGLSGKLKQIRGVDLPESPQNFNDSVIEQIFIQQIKDLKLKDKFLEFINTGRINQIPLNMWIDADYMLSNRLQVFIQRSAAQAYLHESQAQLWQQESISQLYCAENGEYDYSKTVTLHGKTGPEFMDFELEYDLSLWSGNITEILWMPMWRSACEVIIEKATVFKNDGESTELTVTGGNFQIKKSENEFIFYNGHATLTFANSTRDVISLHVSGRWKVIDTYTAYRGYKELIDTQKDGVTAANQGFFSSCSKWLRSKFQ
jgi:hypothetical protein